MMPEARSKLTAGWAALMLTLPLCLQAAPEASSPAVPRAVRRELDRDEPLLRARLTELPEDSGVSLQREPTRLLLRIPARLLFAPDVPTLRVDAGTSVPLSAALQLLKRRRRLAAHIEVYSDSIGGTQANQMLTAQRAHSVLGLLTHQGIAAARLSEAGAGQQAPVAGNDTPEARQQNRRVEISFEAGTGGGGAPAAIRPVPAAGP